MRNISVQALLQTPIEERNVEIVERKGKGHPDYLADGIVEEVSRSLCKFYLDNFGTILHHNVDKSLIVGGRANPVFGGGEVLDPINFIIAGRAITEVREDGSSKSIPIESISNTAIRAFLKKTFRFLDIDKHVKIKSMIKQSSSELINVFNSDKTMPLANDSSFGVGYAPLSQLEKTVLESEKYLNSLKLKKELPEVGEDIKVMGLRRDKDVKLTIATAFISSITPDKDHYLNIKEEIRNRVADLAVKINDNSVNVFVNMADDLSKNSFYLTVTGTSAEQGDDGNTGRGNRVNGLITPLRPMSLEATAGKNPVNHVGKIYNVLAGQIAGNIYDQVDGVKEVYVKILSQIGVPIDEPMIADVQLILDKDTSLQQIKPTITPIVDEQLNDIRKITNLIYEGKVMLY
ncbi:methionine adenosyltransferase [Candidatus Bathyarchaeota archaeon]|nr:methionine adenosyltransferase [Candidatus Bathyarchaeota archaeon]